MSDLVPPGWLAEFDAEAHRAWVENFVRTMNNGGTWQLPSNGQVYKIDKLNKTITLISGSVDDTYWKNFKVFGLIGWATVFSPVREGMGKSSNVGNLIRGLNEFRS